MSIADPKFHPLNTMTSRGAGTHRNDLPTHAHRLMAGVAEEVAIDGNGLPMVLVSPASIIAKRRKNPIVSSLHHMTERCPRLQ